MYPTIILQNQFGEESNNHILGGSEIDLSFTVAAADAGGAGVTGLSQNSQNLIKNVFMHTSQTPAAGNPNPPAGYILVQFAQKFTNFINFLMAFGGNKSGTPISISAGVTANLVYIITALGTTTQAQWEAIGVPVGVPAALGLVFTASTTGNGTGTGVVQIPLVGGSAAGSYEFVGDPNKSLSTAAGGGGYLMLRVFGPTSSSVTTPIATNPVDGTVIDMKLSLA